MKTLSIGMGIVYTILGIICLMSPAQTISVITYIIAFMILAAGIFLIVSYFVNRSSFFGIGSGWTLFYGIVSTLLGILLLFNPGFGNIMFSLCFGAWVVFTGGIKISNAVSLKRLGEPWALVMILGIISILLGIFLISRPIITSISIGIFIGISLLIEGISYIVIGCKL